MASGNGQIVRITLRGVVYTEQWENVYHYRQNNDTPATYLEWATAFWTNLKAAWRAFQVVDASVRTLTVLIEQIGGTEQFGEYTIPLLEQVGLRSASSAILPTFNAAGIKLVPTTRVVRPGAKRFIGLREEDSNGTALEAGTKTLVDNIGIALLNPLAYGLLSAAAADLIIYGPVLAPTEHNPAGRPDPVYSNVVSYLTNPNITSQVSRKVGRGI